MAKRKERYERKEMRKRYLLVACTSSAALNFCNRDEVAVRPRDARLVQVPHVRQRVVRDSAACQDRRPNPHMTSSSIYLLCLPNKEDRCVQLTHCSRLRILRPTRAFAPLGDGAGTRLARRGLCHLRLWSFVGFGWPATGLLAARPGLRRVALRCAGQRWSLPPAACFQAR